MYPIISPWSCLCEYSERRTKSSHNMNPLSLLTLSQVSAFVSLLCLNLSGNSIGLSYVVLLSALKSKWFIFAQMMSPWGMSTRSEPNDITSPLSRLVVCMVAVPSQFLDTCCMWISGSGIAFSNNSSPCLAPGPSPTPGPESPLLARVLATGEDALLTAVVTATTAGAAATSPPAPFEDDDNDDNDIFSPLPQLQAATADCTLHTTTDTALPSNKPIDNEWRFCHSTSFCFFFCLSACLSYSLDSNNIFVYTLLRYPSAFAQIMIHWQISRGLLNNCRC